MRRFQEVHVQDLLVILLNHLADVLIQLEHSKPIPRIYLIILFDSLTHGLTAALLWISVLYPTLRICRPSNVNLVDSAWFDKFLMYVKAQLNPTNVLILKETIIATIVGSVLDIDHFIAAFSWRLHDARQLSRRPFGHAVPFIMITIYFVHIIFRNKRITGIVAVSLIGHHLRDASKRGLWFWPLGSTPPLPKYVIYFCFIVLPIAIRHLLSNEISTNTSNRNAREPLYSEVETV